MTLEPCMLRMSSKRKQKSFAILVREELSLGDDVTIVQAQTTNEVHVYD